MKMRIKRCLCAVFALAMLLCLFPETEAEAATDSITIYVGESLQMYMGQPLTKVSSSNSKAVSAKREEPDHIYATITGVKPGTSTVTCKTKKKTSKIKVTVKKLDMPVTAAFKTESDEVMFSIQNKSSKLYEVLEFEYTIVDKDGNVVSEGSKRLTDVFPKTTTYACVYVGEKSIDSIDLSACSAKVTRLFNQSENTYKIVSSKVKVTSKTTTEDSDAVSCDLYLNNTTDKFVYLDYDIYVYDKSNKLIGVVKPANADHYLNAKEQKYAYNDAFISKKFFKKYHHFKIVVNSYYVIN